MAAQNEIIDGWFVDCKPDNEIQRSIMIEFGNLFERYMLAHENGEEDKEFEEIRSSIFARAKTQFQDPSKSLFLFDAVKTKSFF